VFEGDRFGRAAKFTLFGIEHEIAKRKAIRALRRDPSARVLRKGKAHLKDKSRKS